MNRWTLNTLLLLGGILLVAGAASALTVNSDVLKDTTWTLADSPVHVIAPVRVLNESTLTIQPGVTVRFESGSYLRVGQLNAYGDNRDKGALQAVGTSTQPITFTSTTGVRTWAGIEIDSRRGAPLAAMTLERVTIEKSTGAGLLVRSNPSLTLKDVTLSGNGGPGLQLENSPVTITGGTFTLNLGVGILGDSASPITLSGATISQNDGAPFQISPDSRLSGVTYSGNGQKVLIYTGGTLRHSDTWAPQVDTASATKMPYRLLGDVRVRDLATLTIAPGTTLQMDPGVDLLIGDCCTDYWDNGGLIAVGTPTEPITFTSRTGARDWSGIYVDGRQSGTDHATRLSEVVIEKSAGKGLRVESHSNFDMDIVTAGANSGTGFEIVGTGGTFERLFALGNTGQGIYVQSASPRLVDATASDNGQMGVYLYDSSSTIENLVAARNRFGIFADSNANPQVQGATIEASREQPLRLNFPGAWNGIVLRNNAIREVQTWGATLNADKTLPAFADADTGAKYDYLFLQDTHVRNSATLTLPAGYTYKFNPGAGLYVGACCSAGTAAALVADGEATTPLVFRSATGNRDWQGLRVDSRGTWKPSTLDWLTIRDSANTGLEFWGPQGGSVSHLTISNSRYEGIYAYDTSVVFSDVTITDANRWGIRTGGSGSPTFRDVTITRAGDVGVYGDYPSTPEFERVTIENGARYPIRTAVSSDLSGVTFRANAQDLIEFYGAPVTRDTTIRVYEESDTGAEMVVSMRSPSFSVTNGATLTFEPGLVVRMGDGMYVDVGTCCSNTPSDTGGLVMKGTWEETILITSQSRLDRWGGFRFYGTSLAGELPVVFENVTLEQSQAAAIYADQYDDLTVKNSIFQFDGEGIRLAGSDATVTDNVFQFNRGSGMVLQRVRGGTWYGEATTSAPRILGNRFLENNGYGLYSEPGSAPLVQDNRFSNNSAAGLSIDVNAFNDDNVFTLNGGGILEISGGTLTHDLTFRGLRDPDVGTVIPYTILSDTYVMNGATLTIEPGATLRFSAGAGLYVGQCCEPTQRGSLVAIGEDGVPIRFQGRSTAIDWDGLVFTGNGPAAQASTLEWIVVERASGTGISVIDNARVAISHAVVRDNREGVRLARSPITLDDVTVQRSQAVGVRVEGGSPQIRNSKIQQSGTLGLEGDASSTPVFVNTLVERSGGRALRVAPGADLSGVLLRANSVPEVELHGGTIARDTTLPGLADLATAVPYRYLVLGDLVVRDAATLSLEAGATLAFTKYTSCSWWSCSDVYTGLRVGVGSGYRDHGVLDARGTAARPVTFTAQVAADGWSGLTIYGKPSLDVPQSTLDFVVIERSRGQGLYAEDVSDLVVSNSVMRLNAASGLYLRRSPADVSGSTFASNANHGLVSESSAATIKASAFTSNAMSGLYVIGTKPTIEGPVLRLNAQSGISLDSTPAMTIDGATIEGSPYDVSFLNTGATATLKDLRVLGGAPVLVEATNTQGVAGAWNRFGFRSLDPHHPRVNLTGGQNGFVEMRVVPTFTDASYNFRVYGTDGTLTQSDLLYTDAQGGLKSRVALNGARAARLDVVPVVTAGFSFGPAPTTVVDDVTFTDESTVRFARFTAWEWNFGDGTTSTEQNPVHRYARRGQFTIQLCVSIDSSAQKTCASDRIDVVNHLPYASFTYTPESPLHYVDEVKFTDTSVDPDGFVVKRGWQFGDNVANNPIPSNPAFPWSGNVPFTNGNAEVKHRYFWPGRYLVNLTIEDNLGGRVVYQQEVWVRSVSEKGMEVAISTVGTILETTGGIGDAVEQQANDTLEQAGAVGDAVQAAIDGNVTALREQARALVTEADVESVTILCLEASAEEIPTTGPFAACVADALGRDAAEIDAIVAEVKYEVDETEVPPPFVDAFVAEVIDRFSNPPPPPPPPEPPQIPPEPPTLPEFPPDPGEFPPDIPGLPTQPEIPDIPGGPEVPDVPPPPTIPRICIGNTCVFG